MSDVSSVSDKTIKLEDREEQIELNTTAEAEEFLPQSTRCYLESIHNFFAILVQILFCKTRILVKK